MAHKLLISLVIPLMLGLSQAASTNHLVSYWAFESDTNDSATAGGTADDGTWVGTPDYDTGRFGQAFRSDGSSYVSVPSSADLTGSSNTISVSAWFRVSAFDANSQALIAKGEGANWRITRSASSSSISWVGGADEVFGGSVNNGAWHHVLGISEDGVDTRIYINGALLEGAETPDIIDTTSPLFIGNNPDAPTRIWNGSIDDVGIFNTALSDYEAAALHSLATNTDFNYNLSEVNELFQLGRCPSGTKIEVAETEWIAVSSDPGVDLFFVQLSSNGSGVAAISGPQIFLFEVDHPIIPAGEPITFSWEVDPQTEGVFFDDAGTLVDVTANTVNGVGSFTFTPGPTDAATYIFGALINGEFSTRVQEIVVTDQPIIDALKATPASVEPGETATISWNTFNTTSVTLNGQAVAASGSIAESLSIAKSYELIATSSLGTVNSSIIVPVIPTGEPIIAEFVASNDGSLLDEDGDSPDWIQLTNPSGTAAIIDGEYFLTDDPEDLQKWSIPSQTLEPGESVFYFASGKTTTVTPHANFSLSSAGEYLALVKVSEGITTILSEFDEYPRQFEGLSYGVADDFITLSYYQVPTPTEENSGATFEDFVRDTSFSMSRGFYTASQSVEITSATPDADIYYTTNGSEPSTTNGSLYTTAIDISTTTTLRAIATKANQIATNIDTHSYIFTADVVNQPTNPSGWPTSSVNGQVMDYFMDPGSAVSSSTQGVINALESIPTFSIVTDQANLTDPSTGVYVNPSQRGREWERPSSVELIFPPGYVNPDGLTEGFQENFGLRVRGGASRSTGNPKHAFRLFFRSEYGESTLEYPLFGQNGTDEFSGFDLRTAQNYSWSFKNPGVLTTNDDNSSKNTFMREVFARDTQRDMNEPHTRSRYVHLYLNGIYWGLFMTQERAEAEFAASYFGGDEADYDAIKSAGSSASPRYSTEATDGDNVDWMAGYNLAIATSEESETTNASYFEIQGLNSSGNPDAAIPNYIDVDNLINFMMVVFYNGSFDAPLSTFVDASNNWFSVRNRETDDQGVYFFAHDMEHSLGSYPTNRQDRTGPFWFGSVEDQQGFLRSNPQYIHQYLANNREYRLKFADIAHREFFNGGLLTNEAVIARFEERESVIDTAIDAEAARWGDSKRANNPLDRTDWALAVAQLKGWTDDRNLEVLAQLKIDDLYPDTDAPVFSQHGGQIDPGFVLTMNNPNGSGAVYYTTDGSDPRVTGGGINGTATSGSAVTLSSSAVVQSRVRINSNEWSALTSATFATAAAPNAGELVITEINYHPSDPTSSEEDAGFDSSGDFEFIEITNTSTEAIDLSGVTIANEVTFAFSTIADPNDRILGAGQSIVIVRDIGGFAERYPGVEGFGPYSGGLSNNTATVELLAADGSLLFSVTYDDNNGWPGAADGDGYSLVLLDGSVPNDSASWRISAGLNGNPGTSDSEPFVSGDLLAAVLRDGTGNFIEPTASIRTFDDGNGPQDFLHINIRRYLPVDNATIEIQHADELQNWANTDIDLVSSDPLGDGSVQESYRLNIPITDDSTQFMRVSITTTP